MPTFSKARWRLAETLHLKLQRRRAPAGPLKLPEEWWAELQVLSRQIRRTQDRSWHTATAQLQPRLVHALNTTSQQLTELAVALGRPLLPTPLATVADLYRDITALYEDFEEVEIDDNTQELCVTTPPIELDAFYLGPFQIRLNWALLHRTTAYRVVALQPQTAQCNENVTHPHVTDETLCEGDGQVALAAAVESGRLHDFFLLVSRLLQTYAPGRAYVELSDWHGDPCSDCGLMVDEHERSTCLRCGDMVCGECVGCCCVCDNSLCGACESHCLSCQDTCCSECLETCDQCGLPVCEKCFSDNLCPKCKEAQEDDHENPDEAQEHASGAAVTAIQSPSLGETAVSA